MLPTTLVAKTFAKILDPHAKLNGALYNVVTGTVHYAAAIMTEFPPKQLTKSELKVTPSLCIIWIEYDVMGEPPLFGAYQSMTTLVLVITEVVGALGIAGMAAASTITAVDV